ncbi:NAD-dependent epimerase/dehydratase family protein [Pigmentibacter ruber]|uniref:NAD-dependent epimerase/dehydratase family protein n=1 Tax=Pigmentibacter ruber TaxID=2683196 RepID=UPI00131E74F8|nr:NAD-dependent epimerase/dehydratase family protein [Pigmentibacter ruber]BFD31207.1 SDR family oxidoreductase [Pigmentibacter ruber]
MEILLTGGAGFIGSKVCEKLLTIGHSVTIIDNMSTGLKNNISNKVNLIECGAESSLIHEKLRKFKFDAILHIGGQSSGEIGERNPLNDVHWNVVSTLNLLDYASKNNIKKFIYASSVGVYGSALKSRNELLVEDDAGNPISVYGTGKIVAEKYIDTYVKRGLVAFSLRMFNVYGPGQNMQNPDQGMISIYLAQLIKNKKLQVKGSLQRIRDFVYIDDVVNAWIHALNFSDQTPEHYKLNIGSGKGYSVEHVIELLKHYFGEYPLEVLSSTPGDQTYTIANISKAKEILSWTPEVDLEQGLAHFYNWAINNMENK